MMQKLKQLFNHTSQTMYNGALIIACCTMLGHLLAIVRDRAFAHTFGASTTLDIYFAAFRVPDILFTIGSTLIGSAILLPYLTPYAKDEIKMRSIANDIFTVFAIGFIILLLVVFIFMPYILALFSKGFAPADFQTLVSLSRLLLLSPLILGISNLFGTITQSLQKFFVSALAPVVYNIGIIVGILFLYPIFGIYGLAYGVILGGLLHMGIQLPTLFLSKSIPVFQKVRDWALLKKVALTALPRTFTLSTNKIELLLLTALGVTIAEGSVSVFNLTWNLQNAPLALIGASVATAAFPLFIKAYTEKNSQVFQSHLHDALKTIMFWTIPITGGIIVFRQHIVELILGTGAFTGGTVIVAAVALATFIISLPSQAAILIYTRARYAQGDTWKPFWANLFASTLPVLLAWAVLATHKGAALFEPIYSVFKIQNIPGHEVVVLTAFYSLGSFFGHFLLWMISKGGSGHQGKYWLHVFQCITAAVGFICASTIVISTLDSHHLTIQALVAVIIGGAVWCLILAISKNEEFGYILKRFKGYAKQ